MKNLVKLAVVASAAAICLVACAKKEPPKTETYDRQKEVEELRKALGEDKKKGEKILIKKLWKGLLIPLIVKVLVLWDFLVLKRIY